MLLDHWPLYPLAIGTVYAKHSVAAPPIFHPTAGVA
jgi:hypothetical protein